MNPIEGANLNNSPASLNQNLDQRETGTIPLGSGKQFEVTKTFYADGRGPSATVSKCSGKTYILIGLGVVLAATSVVLILGGRSIIPIDFSNSAIILTSVGATIGALGVTSAISSVFFLNRQISIRVASFNVGSFADGEEQALIDLLEKDPEGKKAIAECVNFEELNNLVSVWKEKYFLYKYTEKISKELSIRFEDIRKDWNEKIQENNIKLSKQLTTLIDFNPEIIFLKEFISAEKIYTTQYKEIYDLLTLNGYGISGDKDRCIAYKKTSFNFTDKELTFDSNKNNEHLPVITEVKIIDSRFHRPWTRKTEIIKKSEVPLIIEEFHN